jgi:hypothetical protein
MGLVVFVMQGWEWIIIGTVDIVLILWGPRLPRLAKALTKEKSELNSKECTPLSKVKLLTKWAPLWHLSLQREKQTIDDRSKGFS